MSSGTPSFAIRGGPRRKPGRVRSCSRLCRANQRFDHGLENNQPVSGAEGKLDSAFGMRHEAGDVALGIADAGNMVHGAVWISGGVIGSVRCCVTEENLAIPFKLGQR